MAAVHSLTEMKKKRKHTQASLAHQASFSPFVLSVDGLMACEAHSAVKRVASKLVTKQGRSYGEVMGLVQSQV